MATLRGFMTHYGHNISFKNSINPFILDIAIFCLDYCIMKKIQDTLRVSENYLAMDWIFPWAYGLYCINFRPSADSTKQDGQVLNEKVILIKQLINSFSVMVAKGCKPYVTKHEFC